VTPLQRMSCVALIMRSAEELSLSKEENSDADGRLVHDQSNDPCVMAVGKVEKRSRFRK